MKTISTSRRTFLVGAAAAAAVPVLAESSPCRLRIGAMSDNHLHVKNPETHRKTKACFDLFRRERVDVVLDTGDIADLSDMNELRFFRACFDEAFAGTETVPFFGVANHDVNYDPQTGRSAPKFNDPETIAAAVAALGMSSPNPCVVAKGYQFVSFRQFERIEVLEANIRNALAANEGNRPVFVMTHEPPFNTTAWTDYWSSRQIRKLLDKYPQVVNLSGHNHSSIIWAANIWQGTFTSINLGAHAQYSNPIDGEATILDVYDDRIDVRRYEAGSGQEIGASDRWSIPLPLDPAHGPYRPAARTARQTSPRMTSALNVKYVQSRDGRKGELTFYSAEPAGVSMHYEVSFESRAADGSWRFLSTLKWKRPQKLVEPTTATFVFPALVLDAGCRHRVTVTPIDSFGRAGEARAGEFDAPANPLRPLSAEPFAFAGVMQGMKVGGKALVPAKAGWQGPCMNVFAAFPDAATKAILGRKWVYCVVDIGSDQHGVPAVFSVEKSSKTRGSRSLGARIYTAGGTRATNRYVWCLHPEALVEGDRLGVFATWGDPGRFHFNSVRFYA